MSNLTSQRRLAAEILKVGRNRVWIDPQRIEDVESAITREEIRKLVHEKVIATLPVQGVSRGRAKVIQAQKRRGRRKGAGSKSGSPCGNFQKRCLDGKDSFATPQTSRIKSKPCNYGS